MARFGRGFIGRQDLKGPAGFEQPIPTVVLPTATTNAATGIGATGATLNGTVNPNGQIDCHYQFQWGATVSYGNTTALMDAGTGTAPVAVNAAILGLTAGVTYHYRIVATNANGTVNGLDQTFTPTLVPGGLLIRERPPTNLSVSITVPDGPTYRLGADDPDVNNQPDNLTFSTSMPGGFDQCSLTLNRDPRVNWPDLQELSTVTAYGLAGSQVAYQGRIEEFPSQAGQQSSFSPTIAGWQNHLQDDQYAAVIFIDRELANWNDPTTTRQINLINSGLQTSSFLSYQVGADPANKIALIFSGTWPWPLAAGAVPIAEAWYGNGAAKLARIQASAISQLSSTYQLDTTGSINGFDQLNILFCSDNTAVTSSNGTNDISANGSSHTVTASTVEPYGLVQLLNAAGASGSPPDNTTLGIALENLAAIGNHGLTLQTGASGTSPSYDDGYLASDIEGYVLTNWCPKLAYSTGTSGTIQPSSFVIPQLAFPSATTPDAIITAANQFELRDWAVWEATTGTNGPTYYSNTRGTRGKQWIARVGPAQLQNAGAQMNRLWNGVIVQWSNVDGTTGLVGPPASNAPNTSSSLLDSDPANPANILGINRWYLLTLGTSTLAGATQVGAIFLQEQALISTSGQAQLIGHVQDTAGNYWPSWMVRAGDSITFPDAVLTAPRRIVSTSYTHTTRTNTIQLDAPPDGMAALLDRLSAAISFTGLS